MHMRVDQTRQQRASGQVHGLCIIDAQLTEQHIRDAIFFDHHGGVWKERTLQAVKQGRIGKCDSSHGHLQSLQDTVDNEAASNGFARTSVNCQRPPPGLGYNPGARLRSSVDRAAAS